MSARPIILWGIAGLLGLAALGVALQDEPQVISLERGLGPAVEAARL